MNGSQQMHNPDFNLIIIFMALVVSVANFIIYCFFGKLSTESFANMSIALFEANWQMLPIKLQKFFIMMIANAQRPLYYHGFNVAILNLETFTKVRIFFICSFSDLFIIFVQFTQLLKTVFTYYMLFKTLAEQSLLHCVLWYFHMVFTWLVQWIQFSLLTNVFNLD